MVSKGRRSSKPKTKSKKLDRNVLVADVVGNTNVKKPLVAMENLRDELVTRYPNQNLLHKCDYCLY